MMPYNITTKNLLGVGLSGETVLPILTTLHRVHGPNSDRCGTNTQQAQADR